MEVAVRAEAKDLERPIIVAHFCMFDHAAARSRLAMEAFVPAEGCGAPGRFARQLLADLNPVSSTD